MKKRTFAIVGLGLMGGSLGLALKRRCRPCRIVGISRSQSKLRNAKKRKIIDSGTTNLQQGVKDADVIFICTPVRLISRFVKEIDACAKPGCIVTDVGSTKGSLMKWASGRRFRAIEFIGSHPMAGSHQTGLEFVRADLYDNSLVFVTPLPRHRRKKKALQELLRIWKKLAGNVFLCDAKKHDQIVAETSHLPHLVASLLVLSINPSQFPFTASGFRDTTRIAQGDPGLWFDIIATNRKNLIKSLKKYRRALDKTLQGLRSDRCLGVKEILKRAATQRRSLS